MAELRKGATCLARLELYDHPGIDGLYQISMTTADGTPTITGPCSGSIVAMMSTLLAQCGGILGSDAEGR